MPTSGRTEKNFEESVHDSCKSLTSFKLQDFSYLPYKFLIDLATVWKMTNFLTQKDLFHKVNP